MLRVIKMEEFVHVVEYSRPCNMELFKLHIQQLLPHFYFYLQSRQEL